MKNNFINRNNRLRLKRNQENFYQKGCNVCQTKEKLCPSRPSVYQAIQISHAGNSQKRVYLHVAKFYKYFAYYIEFSILHNNQYKKETVSTLFKFQFTNILYNLDHIFVQLNCLCRSRRKTVDSISQIKDIELSCTLQI